MFHGDCIISTPIKSQAQLHADATALRPTALDSSKITIAVNDTPPGQSIFANLGSLLLLVSTSQFVLVLNHRHTT